MDPIAKMFEKETLNEDEFNCAYQWLSDNKDGLPTTLKPALLKLVNNEAKNRMK